MKKTISININGQVFNIEEDGYEKLKAYLGAITRYFANYEDSKEILTDIEGRIAEKFYEYLRKEDKQAITTENIDALITSMGTVADFEAIKEEEDIATDVPKDNFRSTIREEKYTKNTQTDTEPRYKWFRDGQRKLIGGVCAGLAHQYQIDVIWIRLLFLGCLGFIPVLAGFSGAIVVIYIACWIAFPARLDIKEDDHIKKLFRDQDNKVLAGVVAGLSKYTGIDLGLLRLLTVLSIFIFGTGIMVYIILWAITPFAKTITDKMQMKGEAITLENIESNIKTAHTPQYKSENALATILLLPFRIIGKLIGATGPILGVGVRWFIAFILLMIGGGVLVGLSAALLSGIGSLGDVPIMFGTFPVHDLDAPKSLFFFVFIALAVPFLILAMAGLSLFTKKSYFNAVTWQTLAGFFLMGLLGSSLSLSKFVSNFKEGATVEQISDINITTGTPTFDVSDNEGFDHNYAVDFKISKSPDEAVHIKQKRTARGRNENKAKEFAEKIQFKIEHKDSMIVLDRTLKLNNVAFRDQELLANLQIPVNKPFRITRRLASRINNFDTDWETIDWEKKENEVDEHSAARFILDNNGDIKCLDTKTKIENTDEEGNHIKEISLNDIRELKIANNVEIEIVQGNSNKMVLKAVNEDVYDQMDLDGEHISITNDSNEPLKITFETNRLSKLILKDNVIAKVSDINEVEFKLEMRNQSSLQINGSIKDMNVEIYDDAELNGGNLKVNKMNISAKNQSKANIYIQESLNAEAKDESTIKYAGNPTKVSLSPKGNSTIDKQQASE